MARTPPPPPEDDLPPEEEQTVIRDDRWVDGPPPAPVTEPVPVVGREVVEEVEEPYEVVPPPPDRNLWPWLLLLLALVLGGIAALWYFTQEDEDAKPVPDVVRLTEADGRDRLREDGFDVRIRRLPNEAQEGVVFAQEPRGGADLEEGQTVTIRVSSGPAAIDVPNVVGLSFRQGERRLLEAGFEARRFGVFSEEPPGTIVAQAPAADEKARKGAAVRVNVSRGTGRVEVPDVVGRSETEASNILRRAGIQVRVFQVPSAEPEGTVVAQSPSAGSEIARGESIRINVSNGQGAEAEEDVAVPDVVGSPETDAVLDLEAEGFTVRIRREEVTDPEQDGVVLRQEPAAGATVKRGSEVAITVGEAPSG